VWVNNRAAIAGTKNHRGLKGRSGPFQVGTKAVEGDRTNTKVRGDCSPDLMSYGSQVGFKKRCAYSQSSEFRERKGGTSMVKDCLAEGRKRQQKKKGEESE